MKIDKMITMVMVITIATIINRRETHERERGKQLCFDRTDPSVIPPSKFMVCFFFPSSLDHKKSSHAVDLALLPAIPDRREEKQPGPLS